MYNYILLLLADCLLYCNGFPLKLRWEAQRLQTGTEPNERINV